MNMKQYMKENAIVIRSENEIENLNEAFDIFKKSRTLEDYLRKIQKIAVQNDVELKKKNELIQLLKPLIVEFKNAEDSDDENKYEELKNRYKEVLKKISMSNFLKNLPLGIAITTLAIVVILFSVLIGEYSFISKLIADGKFDVGENSAKNIFDWVNRRSQISDKASIVGSSGIISASIARIIFILSGKKLKEGDEEIKQELITALKKNK